MQRASYLASMQKSMHPEDQMGEDDFELIDVQPTNEDWLLQGETIQQREPDAVVTTAKGKVHGEVFVTNYRLKFVPHDSEAAKDNSEFDFPLGLINAVQKFGYSSNLVTRGEDSYGIKIVCKDLRTLKFIHQKEKHNRRALYESLLKNAFPNTNQKPFFAELYKEPFKFNGWLLFDPIKEFERMNLPADLWQLTHINENYEFIKTYPKVLVFPTEAMDAGMDFLKKVCKFRSSGRIPALSWHNHRTKASITRSAQPMSGMTMRSSSEDETYLEMIWRANRESKELIIFDARPISNAQANRLRGGGYETSYPHCRLVFLNIHSIHAIRKGLKKLKAICYPKDSQEKFLVGIEKCRWVSHLQAILNGTHAIVGEICDNHSNILVHCSDGWDRTSQLTSLSMLLIDPHYRTLEGFAILIEKEWLSFGHKFAIRFGHGIDNPTSEERAPIFIQWIDCVWQYFNEFPKSFEFNIHLLKTLLDEVYSCRFGTFLFNNEREREDAKIKEKTTSIWSYVMDNRKLFVNRDYIRDNAPLRTPTPVKVKVWVEYYCRHNWEGLQGASSSSSSEASFQANPRPSQPHRQAPPPPVRQEITKV